MFSDMTLFDKKDAKTETLTLRLTERQKERIYQLAGRKSVSAFILELVKRENERQIEEGLISFFDTDDGMPF